MTALLDAMRRRRSVSPRRLTEPGPSLADIRLIVEAAGTAADHGLLRPWQFVHVRSQDRERLGDLFEAAALAQNPSLDADQRQEQRAKALRGPQAVAVVARIDPAHPKIPESEQWISVGGALQNAHLAAESLGWRAITVSGPKMAAAPLRDAFCGAGEHLVGFLIIGTPKADIPEPPRPTADDLLTEWEADAAPMGR